MSIRRSSLILGLAVAASLSLSAKPTFPKAAKEAGLEGVTCMTCHTKVAPPVAFTAKGKYLKERKATEKAKEVDVKWLNDFKG